MIKGTLCWQCANAVPNEKYGCKWSKDFEPVEGWNATPTIIGRQNAQLAPIPSFEVHECPEYLPIKDREKSEFDDLAVMKLAMAIIRSAARNYYNGVYESLKAGKKTTMLIKAASFLSSEQCEEYGELVDVDIDYLVEKTKARAKKLYNMPPLTNKQIKKFIKKKGMTQKELAEKLGRSDTYVNEFMRRKVKKKEERIRKEIAMALDLTEDEIKELKNE